MRDRVAPRTENTVTSIQLLFTTRMTVDPRAGACWAGRLCRAQPAQTTSPTSTAACVRPTSPPGEMAPAGVAFEPHRGLDEGDAIPRPPVEGMQQVQCRRRPRCSGLPDNAANLARFAETCAAASPCVPNGPCDGNRRPPCIRSVNSSHEAASGTDLGGRHIGFDIDALSARGAMTLAASRGRRRALCSTFERAAERQSCH